MIIIETQQQNPLWTLPLNTCGAASSSFFIFLAYFPIIISCHTVKLSLVYIIKCDVYMQFVGSRKSCQTHLMCRYL